MARMAYLRAWRKRRFEVLELAEGTDGSEDNEQLDRHMDADVNHLQLEQSTPSSAPGENASDAQSSESDFSSNLDAQDSSTESEVEVDENDDQNFEQELAKWAIQNKLTRSCLNDLLLILRKEGHQLPQDSRTLFLHGSLLMNILIFMLKFGDAIKYEFTIYFQGMFGDDTVLESGEIQESTKNSPVSSKTGILLILYDNHSTILRMHKLETSAKQSRINLLMNHLSSCIDMEYGNSNFHDAYL